MKDRFKKISLILALSLILTSVPGSVFAEPVSDVQEEETNATVMATEASEDEDDADTASTETPEEEADTSSTETSKETGEQQLSEEVKGTEKEPESKTEEDTKKEDDAVADEKKSDDTVSDDKSGETTSENKAEEETVSENTLSENQVSENAVSENAVSENEVSENEIPAEIIDDGGDVGGNIEMFMDFDEDTVEEISDASDATLASLERGDGELNAVGTPGASYFGSMQYVPNVAGITDIHNKLCWAQTAATMAEINMKKKGIWGNKGDSHISATQIAKATYNNNRYDYYGETWEVSKNGLEFIKSDVGSARDYTAVTKLNSSNKRVIVGIDDPAFETTASGNLLFSTFNFERWASPNISGRYDGYEGNTDLIDAEMENAVWVPNTDLDSIKAMIMEYGSVGIQARIGFSNSEIGSTISPNNATTYTNLYSFCPAYEGYSANITLTLVAWDDSIDSGCFRERNLINKNTGKATKYVANKNGAFLAKSPFADYEYFWISYEDGAFKQYNTNKKYAYAIAYDFVDSSKNDYTYGYDGTNYFNSYYTKKVYGIFKSSHSSRTSSGKVEVLKSIGVGVQDAGRYKLTVYTGYDPSGKSQYLNRFEAETMTFDLQYPGYHTVELDDPILFYKNDVISVCFEKEDASNFNLLVDGVYCEARAKDKKSYGGIGYIVENGIYFNSFTHYTREGAECFFATASNSTTVVSGNMVPVSNKSNEYMRITPRMRLYTSEISMPKDLDQTMLDIKLKKYVWTYTGKAITPLPEVMIDFTRTENTGKTNELGLPADRGGRGYERGLIMYNKINDGKNDIEGHYNYLGVNNTNEGLAAVVVRGKGDVFSGEISIPFKIVKEQLSIEKCKIMGLETQDFQELEGRTLNKVYGDIKDNLIIKYYIPETKHYVTLTRGVDYAIGSIEGENKAGKKLTVMVTGMGTFKNTVKPKFKLRKAKDKKPISDATISVNLTLKVDGKERHWEEGTLPEIPYTGSKIKPEIEGIYDSATGKKLEPGIDYNVKIKYKNNKKAGMASIIIKAQKGGIYSGKLTRYFLITPMHVTTDAKIKFKKSSYKYTGKPIKAYPTVTLYGKKLKKGDIHVEYRNNTGSSTGTVTSQGIVFGRGRYDGYIGYGTFTIAPGTATTTTTSTTSSSSSK